VQGAFCLLSSSLVMSRSAVRVRSSTFIFAPICRRKRRIGAHGPPRELAEDGNGRLPAHAGVSDALSVDEMRFFD